ncbi:MAG: hypothetical protein R2816_12390 [Flavobacteriaceae bacterium]|nr:hypothetical protein [Flavobacteriaceae bacterium]
MKEKKVRINNRNYKFQWLKGTVLEVKTLAKTVGGGTIYSHPNMSTSSDINISSIEQLDIFLDDEFGNEHAFKLENFNFSCRKGHKITIIKLLINNSKSGSFIGLYNHNTREHRIKDYLLKTITRPSSALFWLVGIFAPFLIGLAFIYLLADVLRTEEDFILLFSIICTGFVSVLLWVLLIIMYQSRKSSRFKKLRNAYNALNI